MISREQQIEITRALTHHAKTAQDAEQRSVCDDAVTLIADLIDRLHREAAVANSLYDALMDRVEGGEQERYHRYESNAIETYRRMRNVTERRHTGENPIIHGRING